MIRMQHQRATTKVSAGVLERRWGIDPSALQPVRGQLYQLSGPGQYRQEHSLCCRILGVHALARGEVVHWVDGACRIDRSRFIPGLEALGADVEACLAVVLEPRIHASPTDRQIERLPHELAITGTHGRG